jgi:hypothetical protein
MRNNLLILFSFVLLVHTKGQTLKYEFVKNCLSMQETELISDLFTRNFNFIAKEHVNLGDQLINRSDYYSSKNPSSTDSAEIAVFINRRKASKKSIVMSFTELNAHNNFMEIEEKIKANLTKESSFLSERFSNANVTKYSNEKTLFYLFRDDYIWYIIVSNFPLEENYFTIRSK